MTPLLLFLSLHAQPAERLEVTCTGGPVSAGDTVAVTIRALTTDREVTTNSPPLVQTSFKQEKRDNVVISEVLTLTDGTGTVEITNPGREPVDISGWELQAIGRIPGTSQSYSVAATVTFPTGTILPPLSTVTWTDTGTAPGAFPNFVSAKRLVPDLISVRLFRLYNGAGRIRDEVLWYGPMPRTSESVWVEGAIGSFAVPNTGPSRSGLANHFSKEDWVYAVQSIGKLNPDMIVPWVHGAALVAAEPPRIVLTNGVWSGFLKVPAGLAGSTRVWADTGTGISGESAAFEVVAVESAEMQLSADFSTAKESTSGMCGEARVGIGFPLSSDLAVQLRLSATNEFIVPGVVTIKAGDTNASFAITNINDAVADGDALVRLSATAPGYQTSTLVLVNEDAQTGALQLEVPPMAYEDEGTMLQRSIVRFFGETRHDIAVQLSAREPLAVPDVVIIPAGETFVPFPIRVGSDNLVNRTPWNVELNARSGATHADPVTMRVVDDDDRAFEIVVPAEIVEGITNTGLIRVKTPYDYPAKFQIRRAQFQTFSRITLQPEVTLPAGASEVPFWLVQTSNGEPDSELPLGVVVNDDAGITAQASVLVRDADLRFEALQLSAPSVWLSGQRTPVKATVVNRYGVPQRTNFEGTLRLSGSTNVAQFSEDPNPLRFTLGVSSNNIAMVGEGFDLYLQGEAFGLRARLGPISVMRGFMVNEQFVAARPAVDGKWLIALAKMANGTELREYVLPGGERGRSLALPAGINRLEISDSGDSAWLASPDGLMVHVDLRAWSVVGNYQVTSSPGLKLGDFVIVPGEEEKLLVITHTGGTNASVWVCVSGVFSASGVALPAAGHFFELRRGRTADEFFCFSPWSVVALSTGNSSIQVVRAKPPSGLGPGSFVAQGALYLRNGEVWDADTFETKRIFPYVQSDFWWLPMPGAGVMLHGGDPGVNVRDLATGAVIGRHGLPEPGYARMALCTWGDGGMVLVGGTEGQTMFVIEDPLARRQKPDLALYSDAPAGAYRLDALGVPALVVTYTITNNSPAYAHEVVLDYSPWYRTELGSLGPWQSTTLRSTNFVELGMVTLRASVSSVPPDTNTNDNAIVTTTRISLPEYPGVKNLLLQANHLVRSPDGRLLYAAVSKNETRWPEGVAVVNPLTAQVAKIIPTGTDVRQIAVSPDGSQLYARLGTGSLVRWDFQQEAETMHMNFTNEAILHFALLRGSNSFVVATTERVTVYDGIVPRPEEYRAQAAERYLGLAGDYLWISDENSLRRLEVTPQGVRNATALGSQLLNPFQTDGRYLYDARNVYDTTQLTRTTNSANTAMYPDIELPVLYSGSGSNMFRHVRGSLETLASQSLQGTSGVYEDIVRWGDTGLAFRTLESVILVEKSVTALPGETDLGVTVTAPSSPKLYEQMEWVITVTNHTDAPDMLSLLQVELPAMDGLHVNTPPGVEMTAHREFTLGLIAPHESRTLRVLGFGKWGVQEPLSLRAVIRPAASDINWTNNTASVAIGYEWWMADLSVTVLSAPQSVQVGEPFGVRIRLANAGPGWATKVRVNHVANGLLFTGISGDDAVIQDSWAGFSDIPAGQQREVVFQYRADQAGIYTVTLDGRHGSFDPSLFNSRVETRIATIGLPPLRPQVKVALSGTLEWDASMNRLLCGQSNAVLVLTPGDFALERLITLSTNVLQIAPCENGRHAWVRLAGGVITRVDLLEGAVGDTIMGPAAECGEAVCVETITVPRGASNVVVVTTIDLERRSTFRVYVGGAPLPQEYGPFGGVMKDASCAFDDAGHLYVAGGSMIRELELGPDGLSELRNLDRPGYAFYAIIIHARGRIFSGTGTILDVRTGQQVENSKWFYPAVQGRSFFTTTAGIAITGAQAEIQRWDINTLTVTDRVILPEERGNLYRLIPMGTSGFLVKGDAWWYVNHWSPEPEVAPLSVSARDFPGTAPVNAAFSGMVTLTNHSGWNTPEAGLLLESGPSVMIFGKPGSLLITAPLRSYEATNVPVSLTADAEGKVTLALTATLNGIPSGSNVTTVIGICSPLAYPPVEGRQLLQLESTRIPEGSMSRLSPLVARLAKPAETKISLSFVLTPIDAVPDSFIELGGTFEFAPGAVTSVVYVASGNVLPERNKTALLTFTSGNVQPGTTNVMITIVDDDLPTLSIAAVALAEGNSGFTNATFRLQLSASTTYSVRAEFQTLPGSATEPSDYLLRRGYIEIPAGSNYVTLPVPIIGDTLYETSESAQLVLLSVTNALLGKYTATMTIQNDDRPEVPVLRIAALSETNVWLESATQTGARYQLQSRPDLQSGTWTNSGPVLIGQGATQTWTIRRSDPARAYYRLNAW